MPRRPRKRSRLGQTPEATAPTRRGRTLLYIGGGLLLFGLAAGAAVAVTVVSAWPSVFTLVASAYRTVEDWAADRGAQIRAAFSVRLDPLKPEGGTKSVGIDTDSWNAAKIQTLAPFVQDRFRQFVAVAQAVARSYGEELMIWDGGRSLERQLDLYKRGRTTPGDVSTWTIASSHLFGLAVDLVPRTPSGMPDFERPTPSWYKNQVLPLATQYGLSSLLLRTGKDPAHIELPESDWPASAQQARAQIKTDFPGLG